MPNAFVQNFTCETIQVRDRYAEVVISCRLVVDSFGVSIDAVKQTNISRALRAAVEEAVTVEAPAKKEAQNGTRG